MDSLITKHCNYKDYKVYLIYDISNAKAPCRLTRLGNKEDGVIQTFLKRLLFFHSKNLASINGNVDLSITERKNA